MNKLDFGFLDKILVHDLIGDGFPLGNGKFPAFETYEVPINANLISLKDNDWKIEESNSDIFRVHQNEISSQNSLNELVDKLLKIIVDNAKTCFDFNKIIEFYRKNDLRIGHIEILNNQLIIFPEPEFLGIIWKWNAKLDILIHGIENIFIFENKEK